MLKSGAMDGAQLSAEGKKLADLESREVLAGQGRRRPQGQDCMLAFNACPSRQCGTIDALKRKSSRAEAA